VTMKQIGAEIGVNESRVSQLHARAIRRLKESLGDMNPQQVAEMRRQLIAFAARKPTMAKAALKQENNAAAESQPAVVLAYKPAAKKAAAAKTALKMSRQRAQQQPIAAAR